MATKRSVRKRVAAALKKYVAKRQNPPGRRIRKRSTTIRNAKAVTVKQNPDGTVHIAVRRR